MGVLGGYLYWKVVLDFWFGHPKCHFWYPQNSHFGNHFGPRKSDFWPFYWFWSFSHWNSHWSRKILRTAEGRVVHQKQNLFWKSETKWNNLKPCKSWNSKFHQNKNHLTPALVCLLWYGGLYDWWQVLEMAASKSACVESSWQGSSESWGLLGARSRKISCLHWVVAK